MGIQNLLNGFELINMIHDAYEKAYTQLGLGDSENTKNLMEQVYKQTWANLQEHEDIQQRLTRLG